ncbi:MAG: hypothetical protein Q8L55_12275, partial [Phycisphaerales bacterium]|nr:hypothetical protein [Phycisphaerales bacterium]
LIAGLVACIVVIVLRKGKPVADAGGGWVVALALGVGCAAGAAWSSGSWRPGPSGTTWLPVMALVAGVAGLARGEGERAGVVRSGVRVVALGAVAWMTVRSIAGMSIAEQVVIMAGTALVGSAVCAGLERGVRLGAARTGGWPSASTGLVCAFAASQVLVIGMTVQTAAWVAAGMAAFFGVCLVVGVATHRPLVGRGALEAAAVLLCGLMVHGWRTGVATDLQAALFAALLLLASAGPVIAAQVLGERGKGWAGLAACAAPALAAVALAVVVRPPPFDV